MGDVKENEVMKPRRDTRLPVQGSRGLLLWAYGGVEV
jgi:hypothetical protein